MCMCNFACKRRRRNDLYCVGQDVKPYSLTHSLIQKQPAISDALEKNKRNQQQQQQRKHKHVRFMFKRPLSSPRK